ncbi:MAG: metallophosphoesterase [Clostridia bacterium]|nr:metallophosphoesterase [Clostridia bacterium]
MQLKTEIYHISAGLPREVTFAFVSDLHDGDPTPVLDAIAAQDVDAVLVGGAVIHDHAHYQRGIEFLAKSAARYKTFCCIGNHERRYRGDFASLVASSGAVLLDDAMVEYAGVVIGGLSSGCTAVDDAPHRPPLLWRFQKTPAPQRAFLSHFAAQKGFKLLLCHHPEYWECYIRDLDVDLTLSGHAHGGQWRIFGRGVFAPGQGLFPRYTSGLYHERLLVSRGVGNPHCIPRICNSPMVAIIHIT